MSEYHIIGDIHGHADKLESLLACLGYRHNGKAYEHPNAKAVFLGDFIDRGPRQRDVLRIVMPMVAQGGAHAVMGNHEFNAIAFHSKHPECEGQWLRERNNKNIGQHVAFLSEYVAPSMKDELDEVLLFFRSLPLWLDLGGIRVVHACWDGRLIDKMNDMLGGNVLTEDVLLKASTDNTSICYEAVETLLKGAECSLPEGSSFLDKDGHVRTETRIKWWENGVEDLRDVVLPTFVKDKLPRRLPVGEDWSWGYAAHKKPVFFGHYWMQGIPQILADNVACLDFSVAKDGVLAAYRWSGESELSNKNFVYV